MFPAMDLANPPPLNAEFARFDAWLNLSHLENAIVLVMVRIKAMAIYINIVILIYSISGKKNKEQVFFFGGGEDSPTITNQIAFNNLTSARIASPTHNAGARYKLSQKNRLSVAFVAPGSLAEEEEEDSNTQCESPVEVFTSFHHRSPTRRRPAMFLR
jgi:hypothetical protein